MKTRLTFTFVCMSFAAGCSEAPKTEAPAAASLIDLQAIEARSDWAPSGLAWDAAQEKLYLLDARKGLYVLDRRGALLSRVELASPDGRMLNDLVLTGDSAATLSDVAGYRIDLATGALTQFFCLLPEPPSSTTSSSSSGGGEGGMGGAGAGSSGAGGGGGPQPCYVHRSGGLAFIAEQNALVTAPQYFDCNDSTPSRTDLEGYDASSGEKLWVVSLPAPVFLGGLVWDPVREKMFAAEDGYIVTVEPGGKVGESGLEGAVYGDAQAIALDTGSKALWILDAQSMQIRHVDLPSLAGTQ